jgi:MATE family multidrug resistance protein
MAQPAKVGASAPVYNPIRRETAELLKLAGPVVASRLGIMVMGLTDTLVVGRYSAEQLGLHAMAWAPTAVVLMVALGLLTGVQVMTARAVGRGALEETGAVLRRGVAYSLWLGMAATAIIWLFGPPFLHAMGLPRELADGATPVVQVFALSLPGATLSVVCSSWLEGHARPTPAMVLMWVANIINLAVNLVLVPGAFGLPALGAVGAAWATFAARSALALMMLGYIATLKDARAWGVFQSPLPDRAAAREQRQLGYGSATSNFFEVASFAGGNIIAGWISGLAVAGYAIALNVASIVFMIPLGLATATAVLVARAYGARDGEGVLRAALIGFVATAAFGLVASLIVWLGAGPIAAGYTPDAAARALTAPALIIAAIFFVPDALQVVIAQALRARGDVWMPSLTHMISYALVMLPLAWWLGVRQGLGLNGMMWSIVVASFLSAGLLGARFWMLGRRVQSEG